MSASWAAMVAQLGLLLEVNGVVVVEIDEEVVVKINEGGGVE